MAGLKEAFLVEVRAGAPVAHRLLLQVRKRQVATARRRRPDRIRQLVLGDAYGMMIVGILKGHTVCCPSRCSGARRIACGSI